MKRLMWFALVLLGGCAVGTPTSESLRAAPGRQTGQVFEKSFVKTIGYEYLLYLPRNYGKDQRDWPLVLFLHGAGERGRDLGKVKIHGLPKLIEAGQGFPFIVISPQCPAGNWWNPEVLDGLLDDVIAHYAVDESQVYATGLSMGGYGTWSLAVGYPDRFAAIAPICGGGIPYRAGKRLGKVPAWVFHGGQDGVVPVDASKAMVEAMKKAGAEVKLTIYPEAGHDSWTKTYENPELYDWLLSHRRSAPGR